MIAPYRLAAVFETHHSHNDYILGMPRRSKPIIRPLTGTPNRMQSLPHVNISTIEHHENISHPLIVTPDDIKQEKLDEYGVENLNR